MSHNIPSGVSVLAGHLGRIKLRCSRLQRVYDEFSPDGGHRDPLYSPKESAVGRGFDPDTACLRVSPK